MTPFSPATCPLRRAVGSAKKGGRKKMIFYKIPGVYSDKQAEGIKVTAEGKTYMRFSVEYGGIANNKTIIISTADTDTTEKELEEMFIYYMLSTRS